MKALCCVLSEPVLECPKCLGNAALLTNNQEALCFVQYRLYWYCFAHYLHLGSFHVILSKISSELVQEEDWVHLPVPFRFVYFRCIGD